MRGPTRSVLLATLWLTVSAGAFTHRRSGIVRMTAARHARRDSGSQQPRASSRRPGPPTDGTGQHSIVNLSPGTAIDHVQLTGFSTVKREHPALHRLHGHNQRRAEGRLARGDDHRLRCLLRWSTCGRRRSRPCSPARLDTLPTMRSIQAAGVMIPGVTMSATVGGGRDVGTRSFSSPA